MSIEASALLQMTEMFEEKYSLRGRRNDHDAAAERIFFFLKETFKKKKIIRLYFRSLLPLFTKRVVRFLLNPSEHSSQFCFCIIIVIVFLVLLTE